jgi:Short C-terminal domain
MTNSTPDPQPKGNGLGAALGGLIKSRVANLGETAMQRLTDVRNDVEATARTAMGIARDENTSYLTTSNDEEQPLYEIMASNEGKNARVRLWPDRLEWEKSRGISGAKVIAGLATSGLSLLATGIRGNKDAFDMLPLSAITSLSLRKDGMNHQMVVVQTAGGVIEFRVSRANAADFRLAVINQMQTAAATPNKVEVVNQVSTLSAPAEQTPNIDLADQLQKLASLRDSGILTEDEFQAKKTQLLERF